MAVQMSVRSPHSLHDLQRSASCLRAQSVPLARGRDCLAVVYGSGPDGLPGEVSVGLFKDDSVRSRLPARDERPGGVEALGEFSRVSSCAHRLGHVTSLLLLEAMSNAMQPQRMGCVVAGGSAGSLSVYSVSDGIQLSESHHERDLHPRAAVTGIAADPTSSTTVASCGEDGAIRLFDLGRNSVAGEVLRAGTASLHGISYAGQARVAVVGLGSSLGVFDVRVRASSSSSSSSSGRGLGQSPVWSSSDPFSPLGLCSLSVHPSQPDVIATGGQGGVLTVWDIRSDAGPVLSSVQALEGGCALLSVKFVPSRPASVLTSGADGTLRLWDFNSPDERGPEVTFSNAGLLSSVVLLHAGVPVSSLDFDTPSGTATCVSDLGSLITYRGPLSVRGCLGS